MGPELGLRFHGPDGSNGPHGVMGGAVAEPEKTSNLPFSRINLVGQHEGVYLAISRRTRPNGLGGPCRPVGLDGLNEPHASDVLDGPNGPDGPHGRNGLHRFHGPDGSIGPHRVMGLSLIHI